MSDDSIKNDEEPLFRTAMRDVTPLKPDNKAKLKKAPKKILLQSGHVRRNHTIDDVFSDSEILQDCPAILDFSRSGLQHKLLKKLRQGKYPIENVLDLHGLTVNQARKELLTFITECEAAGMRHVIIVHGKGFRSKDKPIIKSMVNRWLRVVDNVLAFHSARPKDGGNGAVYVLLKKLSVNGKQ
jgi:DNA-nicking Smr family endonuclease